MLSAVPGGVSEGGDKERANSYGGGGGDERDLALSRVLPVRVVGVLCPKGLLNEGAGIAEATPESDECRSF